jgi:hypothetical protein
MTKLKPVRPMITTKSTSRQFPSRSFAQLGNCNTFLPVNIRTKLQCSSSSSLSSGPGAYAPDAPQPIGLLCDPCLPVIFRRSHFHCQVPPRPYDVRDPSSKGWNCGRECWPVILPKWRLPCFIQGSFTCRKSAIWDQRLYFPSKGRCAEDSFPLKNPDGFGRVWTRKLGYLKAARYP